MDERILQSKIMKKTIIHIVGARPNFIKAAPLVKAMNKLAINNLLVHTGQHYDYNMADRFFEELDIEPDHYLNAGSDITSIMQQCEMLFNKLQPDLVIVYGDVNSTVAATFIAKKMQIQVAHIESGLRSYDRTMPEELNRKVTDSISDLLFTTCWDGIANLKREGIEGPQKCFMVGNTMIDTLVKLKSKFDQSNILTDHKLTKKDYVLVTMHRPSNVDNEKSLKGLVDAINKISNTYDIIWPLHPRTAQKLKVFGIGIKRNIKCIPPAGYIDFMCLQQNAKLIITDSGGVQEESSYFNTPCLTVRENTERPVTCDFGTNKLIGIDYKNIESEIEKIDYSIKSTIDLWDGNSSERIVKILKEKLNVK